MDYDMEEEEQMSESVFEITIQEEALGGSYVLENSAVKFPMMDLVVNQKGINKLSDPNMMLNRVKIDTRHIQEKQIIGRGSAGQVRRAVYILGDKQYTFAVKAINASQKEHRRQLLNDLREYLAEGNSEWLIEFYTCYYHDGLVKQVIEYMDMGALRGVINLVAKKKILLSEEQTAAIIQNILMGLHHIHEVRHSVHRDIKPENILLNSRGQIKITDFGVSKCIEHSFGRSLVGTITYMSPERLSISNNNYTYKCDIWSLGLIMYELATGNKLPYDCTANSNYFQISHRILKDNPPQLSPNTHSPIMCNFLSRCLQKTEQERASATQLLNHPWIKEKSQKGSIRQLVDTLKKFQ